LLRTEGHCISIDAAHEIGQLPKLAK